MKKLLSMLCVVAILATCITGIGMVNADTSFPVVETFNADDWYTIEDAAWGSSADNQAVKYEHTLVLPMGWGWHWTDTADFCNYHMVEDLTAAEMRTNFHTAADTKTYLRKTGCDISATKMVDITPGYTYTASTTAYTKGGTYYSMEYWFYHKNDDGTYTPINEYIASINATPLAHNATFGKKYGTYNSEGETVSWDGSETAKKGTLSLSFDVTDPYINAVEIGLGGYSWQGNHFNQASYYEGFTLEQGEAKDIVPNKAYYKAETFTANGVSKEVTITALRPGYEYDYTNTHTLPSEDWNLEKIDYDYYDYHVSWYETNMSGNPPATVQVGTTRNSGEPYYTVPGSAVTMTRYIDIEPGFTYNLDVDAAAYWQLCASTSIWLYHKNADGTYTPINEYLAANGFDNQLATVKYAVGDNSTDVYASDRWPDSYYNMDKDLQISFSVTDASVNAIKIGLGGYPIVNNTPVEGAGEVNNKNYTWYFGWTLEKLGTVDLVPNPRPYDKEIFGAGVTKDFHLVSRLDEYPCDYTGTFNIPGDDWTVELREDTNGKDYHLKWAVDGERNIISRAQATTSNEYYYQPWGSAVTLSKMIEVEPGYNYTVDIDAVSYKGYNANARVYLYHKEGSTYTPINTYLASIGSADTVETPSFSQCVTTTDASYAHTEGRWSGNDTFFNTDLSFNFDITNPKVNVIKLVLGSSVGNEVNNTNAAGMFFGYRVNQGDYLGTTGSTVEATFDLGGGNTIVVDANEGEKLSLRPSNALVGATKVVSTEGYFKAWDVNGTKYDAKAKIDLPSTSPFTLTAEYYAVPANRYISSAQAQKAVTAQGNVIRFLALVDSSCLDNSDYRTAGFVVTSLAKNPTVEAGYKPYEFGSVYAKIKSGETILDVADDSFKSKFSTHVDMTPAGILYANLAIAEGDEATVYYATPYLEKTNGERIYGTSKAISFSQLAVKDEVK